MFEDPRSLLDWGTVQIRGDRNNTIAIDRIVLILEKHKPDVLAIERHEPTVARRSKRIRMLYLAVVKRAEERQIVVHRYCRAQISSSKFLKGARTRREVAAAVADHLDVLRPRLPKQQRIWVGERAGMALFSAAACALTYFGEREPGPETTAEREQATDASCASGST